MNPPDLSRVVETFIRIPLAPNAASLQIWQDYLDLLRTKVGPLVRWLQASGLVGWFSFLVHGGSTGVPTDESDQSWYVHLRLELAKDRSEDELTSQLPSFCEKTRKMPAPWDPLDKCETSAFRDGAVEWGWLILGEGSEWVLRMLESHDPNKRIPPLNVAQLLHYVGNSLLVTAVQIRMP